MRRIELTLTNVRLMAMNEALRTSEHKRADNRDHLLRKVGYELARTQQRPPAPLSYVEIDVTLYTPSPYDADGKYTAVKHLLDCLTAPKSNLALVRQAARQKRGLFIPLGVIRDDTDGEHGLGGCVRRLDVRQEMAERHAVRLVIQEVG